MKDSSARFWDRPAHGRSIPVRVQRGMVTTGCHGNSHLRRNRRLGCDWHRTCSMRRSRMSHFALSYRSIVMPTSENARVAPTPSVATASIVTTTHAHQSAAMEWAAPLPRTYFIGGHRVEHVRDSAGTFDLELRLRRLHENTAVGWRWSLLAHRAYFRRCGTRQTVADAGADSADGVLLTPLSVDRAAHG